MFFLCWKGALVENDTYLGERNWSLQERVSHANQFYSNTHMLLFLSLKYTFDILEISTITNLKVKSCNVHVSMNTENLW